MNNPSSEPSVVFIRTLFDRLKNHAGKILILGLVALTLIQGLYVVQLGETAVKRQLGRLVDSAITPGLYFRIPWGIEQIDRYMTEKVHRLEVQGHFSTELPMLTGDKNFIIVELVVQYKVVALDRYLFANERPVDILRIMVRSALTNTISTLFVDMVLSTDKPYIESEIYKRVQADIDHMPLGIELLTVNITLISPPADAIDAFRAVVNARERKREIMNNANKRVVKSIALARGEAANIVNSAGAWGERRRQTATSDSERFLALLPHKRQHPQQTRMTLYWNSVRQLMGRANIVALAPGQSPNIEMNLLRNAEMPYVPAVSGEAAMRPTTASHRHPGQTLSHITEQPLDRGVGIGGHIDDSEAHHYSGTGTPTTDTEHVIDQAAGQDSGLTAKGDEAESKSKIKGQ